jgi:phage gp46-like protein
LLGDTMQDVLIKSDEFGIYDLVLEGPDFASAEGFETAIPVSYFTDARAPESQVQEALRRRGWVGNILTVDIERELGGLLWFLEQARNTQDTINFAKSYAENSLQWMLDDGIAKHITITVTKTSDREIRIFTDINITSNTVLHYVTLWRNTDFTRILP